ncbi:hypothetical protein [Sinomicrobium weinanense]|uniref:Type VI secretion system baseplate subunit TssG n=1 Tax=Sinomicrobium weinanense TaxID=2842200 RepID=A0A926Q4I5_9FLAO|nr:hypothetical protein [Sinomicrobium weinanense]MBC9798009.1 hypothetical protein [Sinomicrobium weinanense]MBU3123606.1 hypothetical protein [Sinomicrobium weinanense]
MSKEDIVFKELQHTPLFDLKAELLFEMLLRHKIQERDIAVMPQGNFYRNFSKDVMKVEPDMNQADMWHFKISRDGVYDILPEGITHNYRSRNRSEDPVEEYKKRKREEKEARRFFNPLENEFFRFRHLVEKYESDFFRDINAYGLADVIRMILGVSEKVPDELLVKMFFLLMRQKNFVSRNIEDVRKGLETIIGEEVKIITKNVKLEQVFDPYEKTEDMLLGINTTLESKEEIFLKKYHFVIGPLKDSKKLIEYVNKGQMESFLEAFFHLFLPCQVQFSYQLMLKEEDQLFRLNETVYQSRLGVSTVI